MKKLYTAILFFTLLATGASASKKIIVDLSTQRATAYENGKRVFSGRISSGKSGHRTPRGSFRILEKDKWHKSSLYPKPNGGAKMHYMLRLTNGGIALHLGRVPNYPASHGCIRMRNGFAQKMYRWARVGTRVYVKGNPAGGHVSSSRVHKKRKARKSKKKIYRKHRRKKIVRHHKKRKVRPLKRKRVIKKSSFRPPLEVFSGNWN